MRPVKTPDCNFTYKLAGGTEENDLPCRREHGYVTSWWELEGDEKVVLDCERHVVSACVYLPNPIGITLQVGRDGRLLNEASELPRAFDGHIKAWSYRALLRPSEVEALRNGEHVRLAVDMTPPPPVSVRFYQPNGR